MKIIKVIIILTVSILFLVAGFYVFNNTVLSKNDCTETTIATIVDVNVQRTGADLPRYYPILEYEVNGETYQHRSKVNSRYTDDMLGQKVEIKYNPQNPAEASLEYEKTGGSIIFIGFSVIIILGLVGVIRNRKHI